VIAAANPLRSLDGDAASVADLIRSIEGPVLLVAHSYGGAVISNVPADAGEITALVYVNGFAPDPDIPTELQRFMAERADPQRTIEIAGASHTRRLSAPGDR
jgi:pimeloyl-ACP methyl ester carboxylesterase